VEHRYPVIEEKGVLKKVYVIKGLIDRHYSRGEEMPAVRLSYLPPVSVAVSIWRLLTGRISFPRNRVGQGVTMEDGDAQTVFREVRVASSKSVPVESMTILKVRFKFARYSAAANRRLSLIPIPIIAGMPGFRQKIWSFSGESGFSQGIYQFELMSQAEEYRNSPVMSVLEKRSVKGSTSHELFPGILIDDYLESRGS